MAKDREERALVAVSAQGDPGARAQELLRVLSGITAGDLKDFDDLISQREAELHALRQVRAMAALAVKGQPARPSHKKKMPVAGNGEDAAADKDLRKDECRKRIVLYLSKSGPGRAADIIRDCGVSPRWINELLDHPWFAQTSQGVHITVEGRRAVCE